MLEWSSSPAILFGQVLHMLDHCGSYFEKLVQLDQYILRPFCYLSEVQVLFI